EALLLVDSHMAAPPVFRLLNLRKNEIRLNRIDNVSADEAGDHGPGTPDVDVKVTHTGLKLVTDPSEHLCSSAREKFQIDAWKPLFERPLQFLPQFRTSRNGNHSLPLFLAPLHSILPFIRRNPPPALIEA